MPRNPVEREICTSKSKGTKPIITWLLSLPSPDRDAVFYSVVLSKTPSCAVLRIFCLIVVRVQNAAARYVGQELVQMEQ